MRVRGKSTHGRPHRKYDRTGKEQAMGEGLTQVGLLAVLLLVVLPGCFFTLLALLDRMENSLAPGSMRSVATVAPAAGIAPPDDVMAASGAEAAGGTVVELPLTASVGAEPAAATG
jgi:hypothetical protein